MRISDWSSDVCSSDLPGAGAILALALAGDSGARVHLRKPLRLGGSALDACLGDMKRGGPEIGTARHRACLEFVQHRVVEGAPPVGGQRRLVRRRRRVQRRIAAARSEEHTSELQSLMRISYAVFCL